MRVDEAHRDPGIPGKGGVDSVVCQDFAEHAVGRVGRDGPDGVARVDQLDVCLRDSLFQLGLQPRTDVGEDRVARGVAFDVDSSGGRSSRALKEVLPGTLGDADDGVALSLDELREVGDEAACLFLERIRRNT